MNTKKLQHLIAGLICLLAWSTSQANSVTEIDQIVAQVNDDIISESELDSTLNTLLLQMDKNTQLPPMPVLRKQVLERLIIQKLQLEAAALVGINVSEDQLAQTINNVARKNNLTLSEFRSTLEKQGMPFTSYREEIRKQMILSKLQEQEIRNRIHVSDQEVETFLAQHADSDNANYHLSHILIATPEGASPEQLQAAEKKAQRVIGELREGADFKSMALSESDSSQALEGGDLGWRPSSQLPTLFAEQIKNMAAGDISDPIHTPSGFHIIKLNEVQGVQKHIITQTHIRHILISTNELTSDTDAQTRLQQLKLRTEGGGDFSSLARSHSDDKSSAINGGDLGWITSDDLFPQLANVINSLTPGEISDPIRTDLGWHLVQVLERREHDNTATLQKAEAKRAIIKRKMEEENELYLRRLRDEAYVDIRLDQ